MARPQKQTVDYFSHDSYASEGKTLTIIEGEFGLTGYAFWYKLLEWLGRSDGHYYDASKPEDLEFLVRKLGIDVVSGTEILNKLAKLGAIDPVLWKSKLIWSDNFVKRLADVYQKRGRNLPQKPSFCNGNPQPLDMATGITVEETPVSVPVMQQTKVYYNKEKEKEKEKKKVYGEFNNVLLTDDEIQKLKDRFNHRTTEVIEELSSGIESRGYKYKSHYAAILNWQRRDQKGGQDGKHRRHAQSVPGNRPAGAFSDLEKRDKGL